MYKQEKKSRGWRVQNIFLPPEAVHALDFLLESGHAKTIVAAVTEALTSLEQEIKRRTYPGVGSWGGAAGTKKPP
jgi:hypothetical protein